MLAVFVPSQTTKTTTITKTKTKQERCSIVRATTKRAITFEIKKN